MESDTNKEADLGVQNMESDTNKEADLGVQNMEYGKCNKQI